MPETVFTERRLANDGVSTVSELLLDGNRLGFTLEPGPFSPGHPRKPAGRYGVSLRRAGGIYENYRRRFGDWFDGIPLLDVPGRAFIEIHIGNTMADTEGCSLLGANYEGPMISASRHYEVRRSEEAFRRIYPMIRDAVSGDGAIWETLVEKDRIA
jgi:hypothetical protein